MTLRHKLRKIYLVSIFLLTVFSVQASTFGEETMENITLPDGLLGETVRCVMTDHNGYTWIGTTGGVNIFNGKYLMAMRIGNEQDRALDIIDLCETSDHKVYAATESGLYQLTNVSGVFRHILPEIERPVALLAVGDTVYIGGEQGMLVYDGHTLRQQNIGASRKGLDNIVRHYVRDPQGLIWLLTRHDLYCYDPTTGRMTFHDLVGPMGRKMALSSFAMAGSKFFIGTRNDGLYVYDAMTRQAHQLEGIGQIVTTVQHSADGLIAVATDGNGAFLIDPQREKVVEHFSIDAAGLHRLPTNALYCFYRNDNGINWFGTVRRGLVYSLHNSQLFKPYQCDGLSTQGMNVRSFLTRGSQSVIGLQDGMWLIDSNRHIRRHFTAGELGGHIVNNIQWWQGFYVIGMYDGGVRLMDPHTANFVPLPSALELLENTNVGDIEVAGDGSLWIGCSQGLYIIDRQYHIRHFSEQNSPIIGGIIVDITFDRQGNAWLTGSKGVSLYSGASRDIVEVSYPAGFFNAEPYMRGFLGHDGIIYMRNGPQLFYTDSKMEHFGKLEIPLRLTDRWCRGMADDMHGRLWLATELGLLSVDYEGTRLTQIGHGEGLLGEQISDMRIDGEGRMWVATSSGLFTSTMQDLIQWKAHANHKMTLFNVRLGSDLLGSVEMNQLANNHELHVKWNFTSQVLQAEPLLLDYAKQSKRLYEYRVDGGEWKLVDGGQLIDVRNLLIGYHELTVRMAGVPGTETVFSIKVTPSFWAFFELTLLIIGIVALWLWWRSRKFTKKVIMEHQLTEQALIDEIKEGLVVADEAKSEEPAKYQKVKIDENECAGIVKRMKEYLERERVYTNADLKMKDLADVLHLSAPKLSQVFNLYLGENYYDFINRYRLEEFKRLIETGEYKRYTITALSEQCGFKKSNFFSTFRKVEGLTPAEYLKKRGIKV